MSPKPNTLANLGAVTAGKVKTSGITAFNELVITKVYPNPNQPRKQFDDIEELAANIKEHGLLQPITVVKKDDGYMIVSGERRYKAHLHNGAKTIMALILTSSDEQVEELTLIENIQRSDLTDFEVAKHILRLWESGRYAKKSDLANRIGKSDSFVSKAFSCFKLDSEIIDHIEENKKDIPISVMDEIARVKDKDTQKEVYEKYSAGEITRDEIKDFKPKKVQEENFNKTFYFSNNGWTSLFFGYINFEWILNRLYKDEHYELKIKEVSIFTDNIQDDESKISFVLGMTKQVKDAFKSKFDGFISKECKLLEIDKYYKVTIKPKESFSTFKLKDSSYEDEVLEVKQAKSFTENFPREIILKKFELEIYGQDRILYHTDIIEGAFKNNALVKAYQKYPNESQEGFRFELIEIKDEDVSDSFQESNEVNILTAKIKELEKEIEELNNKEVYIVSHRQKKGTAAGGGFRCRALHEHEAIEIAKQSKYKDLANDKNIIWEARTLKSHCNGSSLSDYIGYGFGTVNDIGTYIAVCDGDFEGTITFEQGGEFVKTTHNREYQVIIKEIDTPVEKPKEIKELKDNGFTVVKNYSLK